MAEKILIQVSSSEPVETEGHSFESLTLYRVLEKWGAMA